MRYCHTPVRMAKIKMLTILSADEDAKQQNCHEEGKMQQPIWNTVWQFLTNKVKHAQTL